MLTIPLPLQLFEAESPVRVKCPFIGSRSDLLHTFSVRLNDHVPETGIVSRVGLERRDAERRAKRAIEDDQDALF